MVGRKGEPVGGGASRSGWDCLELALALPLAVMGTSMRVVVRRVAMSAVLVSAASKVKCAQRFIKVCRRSGICKHTRDVLLCRDLCS